MSLTFWIKPIDAKALDRLRKAKVRVPKKLPASRAPTPAELQKAVDSLREFVARYTPSKPKEGEGWHIQVSSRKKPRSGPGLNINMGPLKSTTEPLPSVRVESLRIEDAHPLLVALLAVELSKLCGPQLLDDAEDLYGPHIVDGKRDGSQLAKAMKSHFADQFGLPGGHRKPRYVSTIDGDPLEYAGDKPVLIALWDHDASVWSSTAEVVEQLKKEFAGRCEFAYVKFYKKGVMETFDVDIVPTLILRYRGTEVRRFVNTMRVNEVRPAMQRLLSGGLDNPGSKKSARRVRG